MLAILTLSGLGERDARAQLAIESYENARPTTTGPIVERVRRALGGHGIDASPQQVKLAIRNVGRRGATDPQFTHAKLADRIDRSADMLLVGTDLPAVQRHCESVLADAYANATIVMAASERELMTRAYVQLAQSRLAQGNRRGALAALAEQARSYPEIAVTAATFGPDMAQLFTEMRATEAKKPLGELVVDVNRADAELIINEGIRGADGRFNGQVAAGRYRVLVRVGAKSMHYEVDVESGKTARLELDWNLESALVVSDDWVGVTLTSAAPDAEELAYVSALSGKMSGTASLVVVEVTKSDAGHRVSGALYEGFAGRTHARTGRLARRGLVVLTGDRDDERLAGLAQFIANGSRAPDVEVTTQVHRGRVTTSPRPRPEMTRPRRIAPFIVMGAGALAVIIGGVVYSLDEDQDTTPPIERRHFDTAPHGIAIGAAGVLSIGVGAWLWHRGARSTPTIAVGHSAAMLGWAGTF